MDVRDVTNQEGVSAGLSSSDQEELHAIAPERLAYIESNGVVGDVRFLPENGGFARGSRGDFLEFGFVTVLEDGFVVATDGFVDATNFVSWLAVLTLQSIDPGAATMRAKSAREIYDVHIARCRYFAERRSSPRRNDHDRGLYFRFKEVSNAQLTRFVVHQLTPVVPMIVLGLIIGKGFFPRLIIATAMAVAAFVGGTLLYKFRRGSSPMLPPYKST